MPKRIEISHKTIVFTVLFLIALQFVYLIKDIILIFYLAVIIMSILNPLVNKLAKWKIPRGFSLIVIYLLMLSALSLVVAAIIPALISQSTVFVNNFPLYISNTGFFGPFTEQIISQGIASIGTLPSSIGRIVISVFSNALTVFTIFIFSFYLILQRPQLKDKLLAFFGEKRGSHFFKIISTIELKLGGWAVGQIGLMALVWLFSYIGLLLLDMPFALPLSFLAGLLEIIPNFGPVLSAVPAIIIGFGISPFTGIAVTALYFLIQQVENYVFVPKVMEKSLGINPIIILLAVTVGFQLGGVAGIIVSIPIVIMLRVILEDYQTSSN